MKNDFNTIVIGDIHFGKKDPNKLMKELKSYFFPKIQEYQNDLDLVVIAGDLFDRIIRFNEPSGKAVLEFMAELIELSDINNFLLRLIKGTKTHDYNQLDVFIKDEIESRNFKIIQTLEEETLRINGKTNHVLYIPEEYPNDKKEFYKELIYDAKDNKYDNVFGHGMIDFVTFVPDEDDSENPVKSAPILESKELMRITKGVVVFGHIHDMHDYKDKVFYTGSFTRYSFKDTEEKGFFFIEGKQDEEPIMHFIINEDAPTYATIYVDQYEGMTEEKKIDYINEMRQEYDFVRFISSSKEDVDIIKQLAASDKTIKVQFKNKEIKEVKIDEEYQFILEDKLDVPETVQKFIKTKNDEDISLTIIKNILDGDNDNLIDIEKSLK